MKIWVAYLIPANATNTDMENLEVDGLPFMAVSDVGEDEAEAVLLRDIKHDYGEESTLEIYKAHRLHIRMVEQPEPTRFAVVHNSNQTGGVYVNGPFKSREDAQAWAAVFIEEMKNQLAAEGGEWTINSEDDGNILTLAPMEVPDEAEHELSVFELIQGQHN
jgi:hypothetical protein